MAKIINEDKILEEEEIKEGDLFQWVKCNKERYTIYNSYEDSLFSITDNASWAVGDHTRKGIINWIKIGYIRKLAKGERIILEQV